MGQFWVSAVSTIQGSVGPYTMVDAAGYFQALKVVYPNSRFERSSTGATTGVWVSRSISDSGYFFAFCT